MFDATNYASDSAQLLGTYAKQNAAQPAVSPVSFPMTEALPAPASTPSLEKRNATTSNHIENAGSVAPGATASITADTSKGTCQMSNDLDDNQQASWTETVVSTCCTSEAYSECWFRIQAKTDAKNACVIPRCGALLSNEPDKMAGFRPLSGSIGEGKYQNMFPILILSAAVRPAIPFLLFLVAPLCISFILWL